MADSSHLFEADRVRIANEAKVRTALEQPDFAQREFEKWQVEKDRRLKDESFATAWAKVAWLAEGRMYAMGRELNKLQQRIGRQRKVNRRQHHALKVAHERIEQLKDALKHYADEENWDDDYEDGHWVERVIWRGINDKGTFPPGPDLALVALSDLKKEEEV